ncbi:MAG: prepilin-type N-terminal cleavage/methylation domain-containing protein [Thermodesulfovibrionales bacterium]|nr:prepilin-type N-terminal cleavage/methylation domain-containing protein [Thermodesulfovibrionales bacterium]
MKPLRPLCPIRPPLGGFTLIEVLIAVSLSAMVLAALYSSFFVTQRAIHASEDTLITLHEARTALDIMRREVEAAFTGYDKKSKSRQEDFIISDRDFYGEQASGLSFVTHASIYKGPARVTYHVEEREERLVLIKTLTTIALDEGEAPEAEMVEEIISFTVEASNKGSSWQRTWKRNKMPRMLRITLEVPLGERSVELSITAKPREGRKV